MKISSAREKRNTVMQIAKEGGGGRQGEREKRRESREEMRREGMRSTEGNRGGVWVGGARRKERES